MSLLLIPKLPLGNEIRQERSLEPPQRGNAVKDSRKVFLKVLPPLPHIRRSFQ